MMIEAWIEPSPQVFFPLGEMGDCTPLEFGRFSKKQREWLLRRDEYQCQDPDCYIGVRQGGRGLHAHHIIPQGWWERQYDFGEESESANQPWNGIILCGEGHHNGAIGVHPDFNQALIDYRNGDKEAFKKVSKKHGEMADMGTIYWDDKKDDDYFEIARDRTEEYLAEHPDDPWPED